MLGSLDSRLRAIHAQIVVLRVLAALLVGGGLLVVFVTFSRFDSDAVGLERLGSFLGGAVGALWSLAGLLLIYVAFLGQQQQVLQQEEDLRLQRKDLDETKREMKMHTDAFRAQRFDASFFSLLAAHEDFVRDIRSDKFPQTVRGREFFTGVYKKLQQRSFAHRMYPPFPVEKATEYYLEEYQELEPILGPYWRSLYHVVKYVDEQAEDEETAVRYARVLRARLSPDELLVLFYNLSTREGSEFMQLAVRYNLLKHMPRQQLLAAEHWAELMAPPRAT